MATLWQSLTWLFITRIGAGIAAGTIPTAQAYIADVTSVKTRAKGMALIGAAFGLGFTFGPLIGYAALVFSKSVSDIGTSPWPGYAAAASVGPGVLAGARAVARVAPQGPARHRASRGIRLAGLGRCTFDAVNSGDPADLVRQRRLVRGLRNDAVAAPEERCLRLLHSSDVLLVLCVHRIHAQHGSGLPRPAAGGAKSAKW